MKTSIVNLSATFLHESFIGLEVTECIVLCETNDKVFLDYFDINLGRNNQKWFIKNDDLGLKR